MAGASWSAILKAQSRDRPQKRGNGGDPVACCIVDGAGALKIGGKGDFLHSA
jgi:hypothetical protein